MFRSSNYSKMDIKEESCFLNFCSENEGDTKDFVKKFKVETVTSGSYTKSELEDSTCCSQNEEDPLMEFNETIKENEIEIKTEIKEEHCLWKREDSYITGDIQDEIHGELYSTKPPSFFKEGVPSYTLHLFSSEDTENNINFNMIKDSPGCESDRERHRQESVVIDISSIETSVCSETYNDGKIVSKASSSGQSRLIHQGNINKQNVNNKICRPILGEEYRKTHKCDLSGKCFKYLSHLEKHVLAIDTKEVNNSDGRDSVLNQPSTMKTCKLTDDAERAYKCSTCEKAFTQLSSLKRHKFVHEPIKPHKCNICNKVFTHLSDMKKHKLIHEGIKPHKCDICKKTFTESSNFKKHKLIHEGIKPHRCNLCNKTFSQLSNLKSHRLIHEGIKPHKCNICNKSFTHLSNLKSHKLTHEATKPPKCNICNEHFPHLSDLNSHIFIHEGIKPHMCNICNRFFTQSSSLRSHKLIHEGIKPYKCNICNKSFTKLSGLKSHKFIHEGIKPHKCNICNKAFTASSNLKKHKFIHEGLKPHKCNICNKGFIELSRLRKHKLIHKETQVLCS